MSVTPWYFSVWCFRLRHDDATNFCDGFGGGGGFCCRGWWCAQGTKLWSVDRYEEMEKGSTEGVAIRSDGTLEAGPATSLLYTTGGSYVWSIARMRWECLCGDGWERGGFGCGDEGGGGWEGCEGL